MHIRTDTLELTTEDGLPLRIDLRRDPEIVPRAVVVVVHGFKGFRRWGFFPYVGERLATAGFASLVFDFSMNGIGEDPEQFGRLDLFERNTLSREVAELERVVRYAREESPVAETANQLPVGVLGHSRGTIAAMTVAADQPDAVGALVTWNGVGQALRYSEGQLARWEEDGEMAFTNARTGQRMTMGWDYVVDAREHASRIEPAACAARMKTPHLILHGTKDMAVDPAEAELVRAGRSPGAGCQLHLVEGGTHTFGAVHPFAGTTPQLDDALERTLAWYHQHLLGDSV